MLGFLDFTYSACKPEIVHWRPTSQLYGKSPPIQPEKVGSPYDGQARLHTDRVNPDTPSRISPTPRQMNMCGHPTWQTRAP